MFLSRDILKCPPISTLLYLAGVVYFGAVLAGCAGGVPVAAPNLSDPTEPLAKAAALVPEDGEWSEPVPNISSGASSDEGPATDWVRAFPDPVLIALVDEALKYNSDIGATYARLNAAIAQERVSRAERVPNLSASLGRTQTEPGNTILPKTTKVSAGVSSSWEPDLWKRISARVNAAELESEASAVDIAGARLSITGQVARSWFELIELRLLSELSGRDVKTQERALRLTERRFENGLTSSADVRLARSAVAQAEALQASREQSRSVVGRQLEVLLSRYPEDDLAAQADLPSLPDLGKIGSPHSILTDRPDLIAAERRLAAQGVQVELARKALHPRLSLTLEDVGNGNADLASAFKPDAAVARFLANLTLPVFQGGRLKAGVKVQRAQLEAQLQNYISAVLQAYLEVENALSAEDKLAAQEAALHIALEESQKAEERIEMRYAEGVASILQLLDAQSRRLSAEGQLISARAQRLSNRVRLHVALGGGAYGDIPPDAIPAKLRKAKG